MSWRRQEGLSTQVRLIALDLPGHGKSAGEGEATVAKYARFVSDFIQTQRLRQVILCGHSMGGAIALQVALSDPASLEGLVLASTGAKLRVLPAIFSLIREDFELAIQGMANFLFGPSAPQDLIEEQRRLLAKNSPEVMLQDFTACDSFDIMDKVASIEAPALILCGKDDRLTNYKYAEFLHENIAGSQFVLFENCGHMLMLEQSEAFNQRVLSFVKQVKSGR